MFPSNRSHQKVMTWTPNRKDASSVYRNLFLTLTLLLYVSITQSSIAFQSFPAIHPLLAASSKLSLLSSPSRISRKLSNSRETYRKGSDDDQPLVNDYFEQLGNKRIVRGKQETRGQDTGSLDSKLKYFIPGFVAFWAIGYSVLFLAETSGTGLGDVGGFIGAGLVVVLVIALVGTLITEVFRPQPAGNSTF